MGATSTTYSFPATTENNYEYQAVFTNAANTATSNPATLTVQDPMPSSTPVPPQPSYIKAFDKPEKMMLTQNNQSVGYAMSCVVVPANPSPLLPTGTVTFSDVTNPTSPITLGMATVKRVDWTCYLTATSTMTVGIHQIQVTYSGDANFLPYSVTAPMAVQLELPCNPRMVVARSKDSVPVRIGNRNCYYGFNGKAQAGSVNCAQPKGMDRGWPARPLRLISTQLPRRTEIPLRPLPRIRRQRARPQISSQVLAVIPPETTANRLVAEPVRLN